MTELRKKLTIKSRPYGSMFQGPSPAERIEQTLKDSIMEVLAENAKIPGNTYDELYRKNAHLRRALTACVENAYKELQETVKLFPTQRKQQFEKIAHNVNEFLTDNGQDVANFQEVLNSVMHPKEVLPKVVLSSMCP